MYNNNLSEDIIESINNIETVTMESELSVLTSLMNCYDKQCMIMEYCNDITVFQEGFKDIFNNSKGNPTENIIIRILKFIPRLIINMIKIVKNFFNKNKKSIPSNEEIEEVTKDVDTGSENIKEITNEVSKEVGHRLKGNITIHNKEFIYSCTESFIKKGKFLFRCNEKIGETIADAFDELETIGVLISEIQNVNPKDNEQIKNINNKLKKFLREFNDLKYDKKDIISNLSYNHDLLDAEEILIFNDSKSVKVYIDELDKSLDKADKIYKDLFNIKLPPELSNNNDFLSSKDFSKLLAIVKNLVDIIYITCMCMREDVLIANKIFNMLKRQKNIIKNKNNFNNN